ncbi:MAG TPA: hypothetical protein DEA43_02610 [Candidatus Moranbacteria bacterium]|nr:hypothetical protein [Candidatus Moranbacteria bacterium]HBT45755.1 hypothetical protein [Candidatus Moranbacteria bacterium]
MTTINLHQSQQEDNSFLKSGNKGMFFSLGILAVIVLLFAALKFYVPVVEGKDNALAETILVEKGKIVNLKSLEMSMDTQNRLTEIKKNLEIENENVTRLEITKVLDYLGEDMSSGMLVSEFEYDQEKVVVSFKADNFNNLALQIFNLKNSKYFDEINIMDVARSEEGVECNIEMKIKK